MVSATVLYERNNDNKILKSLTVKGHAGAKESEGYEVCIALSSLTQGLYKALAKLIGKEYFDYKRENGYLSIALKKNIENCNIEKYELITESFITAIKALSFEYQDFIKYLVKHNEE